jgi:hypothetical protein
LEFCLFVLLEGNLDILLIEIGVKVVLLNCFHDEIDIEMDGWNLIWLWRGGGRSSLIDYF